MKGTTQTGIKCPRCGQYLHDVDATRKGKGVIVRTRRCFNDHKFTTHERVVGVHRREVVRAKVLSLLKESRKYRERDPRRKSVATIAAEVGVSSYTVYRIMRGEVAIRQLRRKPR